MATRDSEPVPAAVVPVYILSFAAAALAVAALHGFYQLHNDFWDVYFAAGLLVPGDPGTWFNPQYPIGYTLLLRLLSAGGSPVMPAILANILFGAAALAVSARLFRLVLPAGWTLFSLVTLSVFPPFFQYANAGGGDPGSVLLFTAGAALAFRELVLSPHRFDPGRFFLAGLLMGGAALFRYHALVGGALWAAALLAAYPRQWRAVLLLAAGLCAAYVPQWTVNLLAGQGLLETQFGPMNVYYLMHGIDWYRTGSLELPGSVTAIIAEDPGLFLRRYAASLWSFKQAWLPPLLAVLLVRDAVRRRAFLAVALWTGAYFALFSATTSGRQALLALPLSMMALGASLAVLAARLAEPSARWSAVPRRAGWLALGAVVAALPALHLYRDAQWLERRGALRDDARTIEAALKTEGVTRATEAFTSDYDLYFRGLPGYVPYFNGGAPRLGDYWYNRKYGEAFPEFPADPPEAFVAACRARGVRFVVLDDAGRSLSPAFAALHEGRGVLDGLLLFTETSRHRVYRVLESSRK
jgi:hypothetical protein